MTNRREFCALAALGALSYIDGTRSHRSTRLRIGVLAAPSAEDARIRGALDGVALGADEASRTAALFGSDVDVRQLELPADADPVAAATSLLDDGAQVLITALDDGPAILIDRLAAARGAFVVHLVASPSPAGDTAAASRSMYVAPDATARAEAVLGALHQDGARSAGRAVSLSGTAPLTALAREIDARVAAERGRAPLLADEPAMAGTRDTERALLAIATHDPRAAASLLESHRAPVRIVDLFGVTERFDQSTLPSDLVRADAWLPTLRRFGAAQLNDRFRARYGRTSGMRGPAWSGWFAVKAVLETALRARTGNPEAIRRAMLAARFDGHKGEALSFSPVGVLAHPLYVTGISSSR